MGSILSLFRAKPGTKALLAQIQNEIESIEDYKWSAIKRQKNYMGLLLIVMTVIYIITAIVCYFVYFQKTSDLTQKLIYLLPFIIMPILFYGVRRTMQWYYRWIIDSKDEKLRQLKKEKKKILDKVQETETFKEAKEILEKYDPKALTDLSFRTMSSTPVMTNNMTPQTSQTNTHMRYRGNTTPQMRAMPPQMNRMSTPQSTNMRPYLMVQNSTQMRPSGATPMQSQRLAIMAPNYPRTVKPILPQERGVMEKLVDYMVGDGPTNRYALICIHCHSHNGMALKEEFEYIAYKCCYCMRFNPPRKMRPLPPRLGPMTQTNRSSLTPVVDEPESDTDSNKGPVGSEDNSKMKIEDITDDTEIDLNRTQIQKETEEEPQTEKTEEVDGLSGDNQAVEGSHVDQETEDPVDQNEQTPTETKDSDNKTAENENEEEIAFIDESDSLLSDDTSPVLL